MSEQDIEQQEIDTTKEKADNIGKEIGVQKDTLPDYDIKEDKDSAVEQDERIANEKLESKPIIKKERTQLTSKEKRDLRKRKLQEAFNEKDYIIKQQQERINDLARKQEEHEARLTGINKAEIEKAFNDTVAIFNKAKKDHADAFTEADGEKATAAMSVMYDAQRRIEQLQSLSAQSNNKPINNTNNQADNIVVSKATAWAERNKWYNGTG